MNAIQGETLQKYQAMVKVVPSVIIALSLKNEVVEWNVEAEKLYGYKREEALGKNYIDLCVSSKNQNAVKADIKKVIAGRPTKYFENNITTKKGTERTVLWNVVRMEDSNGNAEGVIASGQDVTERKWSEDSLRETLEGLKELENIVNRSPAVVFLWRVEEGWPVEFVSENVKQFGYTSEELISGEVSWVDVTHPSDVERLQGEVDKHIKEGTAEFTQRYRLKTKFGEIRWVEDRTKTIMDSDGKITHLQGIVLDVTERKEAETALVESEEKFRGLAEQSPNMIFINSNGKIVYANSITESIMGYEREEICSQEFNFLDLIYPDHKSEILAKFDKHIEGDDIPSYETVLMTKDGRKIDAVISTKLIDYMGKKSILGVITDVTPLKRVEAELAAVNKDLVETNKKLEQLALRDTHTGLYNHRYLSEIIESEFYRAKRYVHPLAVIMMDIDYFRSINDVYGHIFGDLVLKQFADHIKTKVRGYDIVVRFGGEEFVIVCPGTDKVAAYTLATRMLESVNLYNFGNKKHTVKIKLSLGIACYPENRAVKGIDLVNLADSILASSKEDGGNRAYTFSDTQRKGKKKKDIQEADVGELKNKLKNLTTRSNQSVIESIFALARTIEAKDHYTGEHVESTAHYATEIARALKMPIEEVERVRQAGMLHDLGKIGISEKILSKKSKLSDKEYEVIKKHPEIAADILRPIKFLHDIIPYIYHHHERWDGSGYPSGLSQDEIPLGARIISIADVYQALISDRPYRKKAFTIDEVIKILKEGSGTQFDPKIVKVFLKILKDEV